MIASRTTYPNRNSRLILGGALLLCVLVFGQTLAHQFITLEDVPYILNNPVVLSGVSFSSLHAAFTDHHLGHYIPIAWISHMVDVELFGLYPFGHHGTNLLLHLLNVFLAYFVLRLYTESPCLSAICAAFFALHPLTVETVAWAAERKGLLSTTFFLAALFAYGRYVHRTSYSWLAAAVCATGLGLLSKPMLVTLPFCLLLLDFWPLQRMQGRFFPKSDSIPESWAKLILEKVPFFALSAAQVVITYRGKELAGTITSVDALPVWVRLANACSSYMDYLLNFFIPHNLAVFYPYPPENVLMWKGTLGLVLLICCTLACVRMMRSKPWMAFGWFWFLGTLVPVIGIVQSGDQAMADRFMYIPMLGLIIAVVWGVAQGIADSRKAALARPLITTVLLLLAAFSFIQVGYWRNSITLFTRTLEVTDTNAKAHLNLAIAYSNVDADPALAQAHMSQAAELDASMVAGWLLRTGEGLLGAGKLDRAEVQFEKALALNTPLQAHAHNNMAAVLVNKGRLQEARKHLKKALELNPEYTRARKNLEQVVILIQQNAATPEPPEAQ